MRGEDKRPHQLSLVRYTSNIDNQLLESTIENHLTGKLSTDFKSSYFPNLEILALEESHLVCLVRIHSQQGLIGLSQSFPVDHVGL